MEDKARPFSFEGARLGIIGDNGFKELPIVEDSTLEPMNDVKIREMIEVEPIDVERFTKGSYSFSFNAPNLNKTAFAKLLGDNMHSQIDNAVRSSVIIQSESYIKRPKNLKYPNKRRKMRIWKKWAKRFGKTPSTQVVIPRAVISFKPEFKNNQLINNVEIIAEKFSK